MARPDPERMSREFYPFHIELQTRFADVDPNNHINNVAIATHFENARIRFFMHMRGPGGLRAGERRAMLAQINIHYVNEAHFPEPLECGAGVKRVGNSSLEIAAALFQRGRCVAVQDCTLVRMGPNGPVAVEDELRRDLERFLVVESRG